MCMWMVSTSFLKSCTFLESRFKSYGKRVGNTRHACQGLGHQATLARCQVNSGLLLGSTTNLPAGSSRSRLLAGPRLLPCIVLGRQAGRKAQLGIAEQCGAAVTTAGTNSLAHNTPLLRSSSPSTASKGCSYLKYIIHSFLYSLLIWLFSCCFFLPI